MLCKAIPYEGQEPYIFFSYSHKDAQRVYPLLEQMVRDGCRIWYDDGNHPGDQWPENIARHLHECWVCIAMVSENSSASHNCRNELSFALECEKKLIAVLLEEFSMPLGMRLQLGSTHYLKKFEYPSEAMLLQKIYEVEQIQACRAEPGSIAMREIESEPAPVLQTQSGQVISDFVSAEKQYPVMKTDIVELPSEEPEFSGQNEDTSEEDEADQRRIRRIVVKPKAKTPPAPQESHPEFAEPEEEEYDEEEEKTVRVSPETTDDGEEDPTVRQGQQPMALLRISNGQGYILESALTRIGRSARRCDVVLTDNPSISNYHADIIQYNENCYLRDAGSANGTFVNQEKLEPEGQAKLSNPGVFRLYDETFVLLMGNPVHRLRQTGKAFLLLCPGKETGQLMQAFPFFLDRRHKWEDGTLDDPKISRKHAKLWVEQDQLYLEDVGSANGTYVNERLVSKQEAFALNDGDSLRLGDTILEIHIVSI